MEQKTRWLIKSFNFWLNLSTFLHFHGNSQKNTFEAWTLHTKAKLLWQSLYRIVKNKKIFTNDNRENFISSNKVFELWLQCFLCMNSLLFVINWKSLWYFFLNFNSKMTFSMQLHSISIARQGPGCSFVWKNAHLNKLSE